MYNLKNETTVYVKISTLSTRFWLPIEVLPVIKIRNRYQSFCYSVDIEVNFFSTVMRKQLLGNAEEGAVNVENDAKEEYDKRTTCNEENCRPMRAQLRMNNISRERDAFCAKHLEGQC
ncbi:hypothetical protein V1477_011022 [Vespula maculifrons]|uniref:Uncharacterized protein n=1 Tax=Vespula maculifrons TaxID=7453 RepID=A0ABD2C3L2_VESMC